MVKYQKNNKVVYLHKYPDSGIPYYVGIGKPTRPYIFEGRSEFWTRTYNKYGIEVEIVQEGLTWEQACIVEQTLIKLYGRRDLGTGSLVNLTDGGEGGNGYQHTNEIKLKCSAAGKKAAIIRAKPEIKCKESSVRVNKKVKLLSKKMVESILSLYEPRYRHNSAAALARRFQTSVHVVEAIINGTSPYLELYELDSPWKSVPKKNILNDEAIKYIKSNYKPRSRQFSSYALARKFNVSQSTVRDVLKS